MHEYSLERDVATLTRILDDVVAEQAGGQRLAVVREVCRLSKERRLRIAGAEKRLLEKVAGLSVLESKIVIRTLSIYFDLLNLAEDEQRARVLRQREVETAPLPRPESLADAIIRLRSAGRTPQQIQELLDRLRIGLVFTAHPTEAKRRTTRNLLRRFRDYLDTLNRGELAEVETEALLERMYTDMTILWQSDQIRPRRPVVMDEVRRGLSFMGGLWEAVPPIYRELHKALAASYPAHAFRVPTFLRFGSWIGGDRDGNPHVTCDVTRQTLAMLRSAALEGHLARCRQLNPLLTMSDRQVRVTAELKAALAAARQQWPEVEPRLQPISEMEVYRRWLVVLEYRLEQTLAAGLLEAAPPAAYRSADELAADVELMAASANQRHGARIARGYLDDWLIQIRTFQFHSAELDLRHNSRVHLRVLGEVMQTLGVPDYPGLSELAKREALMSTLPRLRELQCGRFSAETEDTLRLFEMLARATRHCGGAVLGGYIISMTHEASDVLAVLWLWRWASLAVDSAADACPYLPIIPLFETLDDLTRAPQILGDLLSNEVYAADLARRGQATQLVMIGYSDSTKDGGYLAAYWARYRAMETLAGFAQRRGVRMLVFHGRGGALGRGGGPTARAIRSLPRDSVAGGFRMTEQGEVLTERYDHPFLAHRHLEQVIWATMLVSSEQPQPYDDRWVAMIELLAQQSFRRYRELVDTPGFIEYFHEATPLDEIERLPIGSRPSRRGEFGSLDDLRSIPWTFAWTQCRQLIPAWFGLGTAIDGVLAHDPENFALLREMYDQWPMFRACVDNAELALAKADVDLGRLYASLVRDHDLRQRLWGLVSTEYGLSRRAVLTINGQHELLGGVSWLQRSIRERNPFLDPLHLVQIDLLRRLQSPSGQESVEQAEYAQELLRLSIQGVAAGLRSTG